MRALDLCCGAGGAGKGLVDAGLVVTGVDIKPQPRYPFSFIQCSIMDLNPSWVAAFDFIWASPPCQKHTAMKTMHNAKAHQCLIEPVRSLLRASGRAYAIENVVGAPLINPSTLCGTQFRLACDGMELQRHREVECSFPVRAIGPCRHHLPTLGLYGGHVRDRRRRPGSHARGLDDPPLALAQRLMGIDWMTLAEMCEAIPPAYSQHIARQWLLSLNINA